MAYDQAVGDYIHRAPSEQIPILEELRELVHHTIPGVTESIKWGMPVFSHPKNFAYMRSNKNHITFGFYNEQNSLQDPDQLLEGEGQSMKHVKIKTLDERLKEQIEKWLIEADS